MADAGTEAADADSVAVDSDDDDVEETESVMDHHVVTKAVS